MDHSWRPPPILQGNNICPTCSNIHFPFCPPHPHPNSDLNYRPINMNRPVFDNPGYPYYDPMYCNQNPNFGNVNRSPYSMQNHGYDYSNVNDRSSKRLRVDGDANYSALNFPVEDKERNYKLDYEHDVPNLGYNGDNMRGYALQNSVFGRNFDGWNPGIPSEFGIRPPSNAEMSSNPAGVGYGVPYQNDHPVAHPIHQGGIGHDNDRQSHGYNHHRNYGVSHGSSESFYGRSMESMHYYSAPMHYDQRSNTPTYNHYSSSHPSLPSAMQQPGQLRYDYGSPRPLSDVRQPIETGPPPIEGYQVPGGNHIVAARPPYGHPRMENQGAYGNPISENMGRLHASQGFDVQPPLPASPPPPLPLEPPPLHWQADHKLITSPHTVSSSLFPVPVGSSAPVHSSHAPIPESHAQATSHLLNSPHGHMSHGVFQGDPRNSLTSFGQYLGDSQRFPPKNNFPDKPKTIDAANLFKTPHRSSRPDHFVIILRGLPGSGKSYLAKMLRDLEVEHGGNAPRIHSMDDYFMTEVEKVEEESSKSSARFKKPTMKKVLEYCYEPEMEEAYRSSMLKSFKKTLEDGTFTFVIGMVNV